MATRTPAAKAPVKSVIPQVEWNRPRPAPVVLISGPSDFLADRAIRGLRDLLRAEDPDLEVTEIDAGEYLPGELITLASPSLFDEARFLRADAVEKCTDAFIDEALSYLEHPADGATLVLRHAGGVRGKRLLDAIRGGLGGGIEIVCIEPKKDQEKQEFVADEFAAAGRRITGSAIRALVSAFSDDLAELAGACQQLLADSADEITEVTVDRYYGGRIETNAFQVADAAIAGRRGDALVLLRHALATGADPVPIVAAFAAKIRTMAKLAGSTEPAAKLAQRFGLAPWQVDRGRRDLHGWTEQGLARTIEAIAEADAQVKGEGRDPVYALEHMIAVVSTRGD